MKRRSAARWTISRGDLLQGGGELVRLHHPLLPEVTAAWLCAEGLVLLPEVPLPDPLPEDPDEETCRGLLVRLLGLLGFLRAHGLGLAAADVRELGTRRG